jgi:hypothetical protein
VPRGVFKKRKYPKRRRQLEQMFQLLYEYRRTGLTGRQLQTLMGWRAIPPALKDECIGMVPGSQVRRPRVYRRWPVRGGPCRYHLTEHGAADLAVGRVYDGALRSLNSDNVPYEDHP